MPLFIIAIIFLIGLLIYVIVGYSSGINDGPLVKDRFPDKFKQKRSEVNYTVEEDDDVPGNSDEKGQPPQNASADDKKNVYFPTDNIELEKHKRNIH